MANRTYEVMYIAATDAADEDISKLRESLEKVIQDEGGSIVRTDDMGRRRLAYPINKKNEGYYVLFEIEGSGKEILELERRMRVNDLIVRFMTVRVDEERKAAEKIRAKREARQTRRNTFKNDESGAEQNAGATDDASPEGV